MAGLDNDYGGKVFFDGEDATSLSSAKRNIAMVFQDYALYPNMVARENIVFPLRIRKYSQERLTTKLDTTVKQIDIGVDKYLDYLPRQLSAGHQQRVATGRAIIRDDPRVFLLDEPLTNLDAKIRMNTRTYLKKLVTDIKSTTIYVTADSNEALALADRLAVLDEGRFVQVDRPFDMYFHPKTMLVADFFGTLGMNFLEGMVMDGRFIFEDKKLGVPAYIDKETIDDLDGKKVILGIRPEDVAFSKEPSRESIKVEVQLIQTFPPKANMICTFKEKTINVVAFIKNTRGIKPGGSIYFDIAGSNTHLFDPETREAII
ncbi:MAG: ABC transporter ATP-binding protein [Actinobacteria bacterium]|nr:ABC transporter ATP-binding protein [Actinomycetota bacterium]